MYLYTSQMAKQFALSIKNKKAAFEYNFLSTYKAGIMLTGTEIKSIRDGKANLADSFCVFFNEELWIKNLHISEYSQGSYNNHDPKRLRKLLLNKSEIDKIKSKMKEKGNTIIPIQIFFNERGFAKVEIALARGKKMYDKREAIKKKDLERYDN
jgi:SsrA-binding protein